jgi:ABC-2 type transport system ATP-binding protein
VAINVDPDVLLVDEVLAVGDEQFQRRCSEKFGELRAEGKTIVVVSHALGTLQQMCDQLAWLDNGVLRAVGPAGDVVDEYLTSVQVATGSTEVGRFGTGEVRIAKAELLGPSGRSTTKVRTGDRVVFRLHYEAQPGIERPVFGIGIYSMDGTMLSGPNIKDVGLIPDTIGTLGTVEVEVPQLMLLPGTYDLATGITDDAVLHVHDHWRKALQFDVLPGNPREAVGGHFSLGGNWRVLPATRPARRASSGAAPATGKAGSRSRS